MSKKLNGYEIKTNQMLGKGAYGSVHNGKRIEDGKEFAIKIIPKDKVLTARLKNAMNNQINILKSIKSKHIVSFYDFFQSENNYYIVQQKCDQDLSKTIISGQHPNERDCIDKLTQISEGLFALIKEGIIHRDLKPGNILIKKDILKIADFGFSKQFEEQIQYQPIKMRTRVGTLQYTPIEVLKHNQYTSKCDIFSVGVIFYELLHGKTPWQSPKQRTQEQSAYKMIKMIQNQPLKIQREDISAYSVNFLKRCLEIYECNRMSWSQFFRHPIFNGRFNDRVDENKDYENKMKSIMTKLRFIFQANSQILIKFLKKHGFEHELYFEEYYQFLKAVNPELTKDQAYYIFQRTDIDKNGTISISQIMSMFKGYGIKILSQEDDPIICIKQPIEQLKRICFIRMRKVILETDIGRLFYLFSRFARTRNDQITMEEFVTMIKMISPQFTRQQIRRIFESIKPNATLFLRYDQFQWNYYVANYKK